MSQILYKLVFFAPKQDAQNVSQAMFKAGAGKIGDYDSCCFMTEGTGQFRPGENSDPHIGTQNQLEYVSEMKVEMICVKEVVIDSIKAMKASHPYEEVAYDVIKLANHEFEME